jgi:hypothetical protein
MFTVRGCRPHAQPPSWGPPLVGCPRLLIQYISSYPPYPEDFPPSATWGRAMLWWQGTQLTWRSLLGVLINSVIYSICTFQSFLYNAFGSKFHTFEIIGSSCRHLVFRITYLPRIAIVLDIGAGKVRWILPLALCFLLMTAVLKVCLCSRHECIIQIYVCCILKYVQ